MLSLVESFLLLVAAALGVCGSCPTPCRCPNSQVANCASKALIKIPTDRFDDSLKLLDISDNILVMLDKTSLKDVGVSSLEYLNASDNKIHRIYEKAFVKQSKLHTVDLSRNRLIFIEPNTFKHNRYLNTLLLANNEYLDLPERRSFLISNSVTVLDLSACNLLQIPPKAFRDIPNLEVLYISHNKIKVLPLLQTVGRLTKLDISYNYLTDLKPEVFTAFPKVTHLNLSHNKLSTLSTTVMSQLANVRYPEYLKGNHWVCDCGLYETYSWCNNNGIYLEIMCSVPPKCKSILWTDCYKEGCDGNDSVADQVEEMKVIGYTTVPSGGFENHGNQKASDSGEITVIGYTTVPSGRLENYRKSTASVSFTTQKNEQNMKYEIRYVNFLIALIVLVTIV